MNDREEVEDLIVSLLRAKRKTKHYDLGLTKSLHNHQRRLEKEYGILGAALDGLGSECSDCERDDFEWTWCTHEDGHEEITPLCEQCIIDRIESRWENGNSGWEFTVSDYAENYWYQEYLSGAGDW